MAQSSLGGGGYLYIYIEQITEQSRLSVSVAFPLVSV